VREHGDRSPSGKRTSLRALLCLLIHIKLGGRSLPLPLRSQLHSFCGLYSDTIASDGAAVANLLYDPEQVTAVPAQSVLSLSTVMGGGTGAVSCAALPRCEPAKDRIAKDNFGDAGTNPDCDNVTDSSGSKMEMCLDMEGCPCRPHCWKSRTFSVQAATSPSATPPPSTALPP